MLVREFHDQLVSTVQKYHRHTHDDLDSNHLGCRLIGAFEQGLWTENQFRHNMVAVFLAGHENPQLLLTSMLFLLGENQVSS